MKLLITNIINKQINYWLHRKVGKLLGKYRLYRRTKSDKGEWLSTTKGDIEYIMTVLQLNLEHPELIEFEYMVTREDETNTMTKER